MICVCVDKLCLDCEAIRSAGSVSIDVSEKTDSTYANSPALVRDATSNLAAINVLRLHSYSFPFGPPKSAHSS